MEAARELIWSNSYSEVTVNAICDRARVRKGTFYHFFESKPELVEAVITTWWSERKTLIETVFRQEIKPLERIWTYLEIIVQDQLRAHETNGQVMGAPLFFLASEVSAKHEKLRTTLSEIVNCGVRYFEDAIREAQASGEAGGEDAALTARLIWGFYTTTLIRARIDNNPGLIRTLVSDARKLIELAPGALQSGATERSENEMDFVASIGYQTERGALERESTWRATLTERAMRGGDADEMLVLADVEGRVEWVNEAFRRTCGYSLEELRGQRPGQVLQGAETDPATVAKLREAVRALRACDCWIVNYKKNGTPYWVFIALRPVFVRGKFDGYFAVERERKSGAFSTLERQEEVKVGR